MASAANHYLATVTQKSAHARDVHRTAEALEEILRLEAGEDGTVKFGVSENHLFFDAGDRRLLARMIDVNFPNYMEVIARDNDRHVMVDRERLLSTIRRISLVANERTRAVRFDFAPGKAALTPNQERVLMSQQVKFSSRGARLRIVGPPLPSFLVCMG